MILVGHSDSDDLEDCDMYHKSLEEHIARQPELVELKHKEQFVSVGFVHNPDELCLNTRQKGALLKWYNQPEHLIQSQSFLSDIMKH